MNTYLIQSDKQLKDLISGVFDDILKERLQAILPVVIQDIIEKVKQIESEKKDVLNLKEVCKLLGGKSPQYVRKLMRTGELPFFKSKESRLYQIKTCDVINLMQENNSKSKSPYYQKRLKKAA